MAKNTIPKKVIAPAARELQRTIDTSIVSDLRRQEIMAEAEAKVRARQIVEAEEALLDQEMERLERIAHPETVYEMRDIRINLALYADRITIDGKPYYAGELYTVPKPVFDVLKECESRSFKHDDEIHSGDTNDAFYRKSREVSLNMRTGSTSSAAGPVRF
jgi:hypothetical protein